jgi:hypothetical protein
MKVQSAPAFPVPFNKSLNQESFNQRSTQSKNQPIKKASGEKGPRGLSGQDSLARMCPKLLLLFVAVPLRCLEIRSGIFGFAFAGRR